MTSRLLVRGLLLGLGVAILAIGAVAWILGSKLIDPANHPVTLPAGFEARTVSIPGAGHAVAGWWVDEGQGSPVILLVHGIRADRFSMVTRAQLLTRHGFSVLLIDLQAHGETPGTAITLGYRESADVVAARDWIRRTAPGRRTGVIGMSLGGASVLLAPQPVGLLLQLQLQPRLHVSESELEPIRSIGRLAAPVLVVAGSRDEHTTLPESRELFAAAAESKAMWVVEGATHQDFLRYDRAGYERNVLQFLTQYLNPVALAED